MVNIIVPCYNSRATLPALLDSLVAQTKKLFVVTLINDAGEETYDDIVSEYTRRGLHIYYINKSENEGPGLTRQYGIDHSKQFSHLMFADSDDMFMPRAVEILTKAAQQTNADIIDSDFLREHIGDNATPMPAGQRSITWMHGKIYKREYLERCNIRFREDIKLNEDSYFNLVAWNATDNHGMVNETTYLWRDNKDSLTRQGEKGSFFKKSWIYYIMSQVYGLKKLYEIRDDVPASLVAVTLINCYKYLMRAVHEEVDDYEEGEKYLTLLRTNTKLQDTLKTADFWLTVPQHLPACEVLDDGIFFYKERFNDWLKENVAGEEIK